MQKPERPKPRPPRTVIEGAFVYRELEPGQEYTKWMRFKDNVSTALPLVALVLVGLAAGVILNGVNIPVIR